MIAVVVNEVLLADILTVRAETGQTKDDNLLAHARMKRLMSQMI